MTIALVANTSLTPVANSGGTTASINTTGVNLICITVASYSVVSPPTLSDNKSNSYTQAILKNDAIDNGRVAIFYCLSPTVGSGHTFTLTGVATYCTMCVEAFSGADTGFGIDQISTPGSSSSSPVSAGSVTPGANGSLVYTGAEVSGDATGGRVFSINSGMTISDQVSFSSGVYFGSMGAYLIQGTAAAINPSVSYPGTVGGMAAGSITFRATGGSPVTGDGSIALNIAVAGVGAVAAIGSIGLDIAASGFGNTGLSSVGSISQLIGVTGVAASAATSFGSISQILGITGVGASAATSAGAISQAIAVSGSGAGLAASVGGATLNIAVSAPGVTGRLGAGSITMAIALSGASISSAHSVGSIGLNIAILGHMVDANILYLPVYTIMRNSVTPTIGSMNNTVVACQGDFGAESE